MRQVKKQEAFAQNLNQDVKGTEPLEALWVRLPNKRSLFPMAGQWKELIFPLDPLIQMHPLERAP
ncbi:MAG: hypothetical protein H5T33_05730 [Candidatus Methanosuratus sp.]|nr:hypothetical protein [Candidatus Methanosuratincola sp.]